jgi:hypothetical protein
VSGCSVDGCGWAHEAKGYCKRHYLRWRRWGDPVGGRQTYAERNAATCTATGDGWACDKPCKARKLCGGHWSQKYLAKLPLLKPLRVPIESQVCQASGVFDAAPWVCDKPRFGALYCVGHIAQGRTQADLKPIGMGRYSEGEYRYDAEGNRRCSGCNRFLPVTEFSKNAGAPDGLYSYCRSCKRAYALQARYGLPIAEYEALAAAQGNACAVCGSTDELLHVDHDHLCCRSDKTCGKCVRGLLCTRCNQGLGHFRDSPDLLLAAVAYLRERTRAGG